MSIITNRKASTSIFDRASECGVTVAIFCTGSHWNTEAILIAADRITQKYGLHNLPVVIASTFTYTHMPQAKRFLYCQDPRAGLLSNMGHLNALCGNKYAPYAHIAVMPHLDHANPVRDQWALSVGTEYFSSVMFDTQGYSYEKGLQMTKEYVDIYGNDVLVEGIIETLSVGDGTQASHVDDYCTKAEAFAKDTGIDFLVADLGTEQQSSAVGHCSYLKNRAQDLTAVLGKKMLVLHGLSCLSENQIRGLAADGVIRANMWTRIAREAGQYAAERTAIRLNNIRSGVFEDAEATRYIRDNIEKAADVMESIMELLNYQNWRG